MANWSRYQRDLGFLRGPDPVAPAGLLVRPSVAVVPYAVLAGAAEGEGAGALAAQLVALGAATGVGAAGDSDSDVAQGDGSGVGAGTLSGQLAVLGDATGVLSVTDADQDVILADGTGVGSASDAGPDTLAAAGDATGEADSALGPPPDVAQPVGGGGYLIPRRTRPRPARSTDARPRCHTVTLTAHAGRATVTADARPALAACPSLTASVGAVLGVHTTHNPTDADLVVLLLASLDSLSLT